MGKGGRRGRGRGRGRVGEGESARGAQGGQLPLWVTPHPESDPHLVSRNMLPTLTPVARHQPRSWLKSVAS